VIIERFEEMKARGLIGEPTVRRGVILPELADLLRLPAPHGLWRFLVPGLRSAALSQRPAADAGAVDGEAVAAEQFGSGRAVGKRWRGREQTPQRVEHLGGPRRRMITARSPWAPALLAALGTGAQVFGVERVEAAAADLEFRGGFARRDLVAAEPSEHIADEGSRVAAA
jgi:hypothetical protein